MEQSLVQSIHMTCCFVSSFPGSLRSHPIVFHLEMEWKSYGLYHDLHLGLIKISLGTIIWEAWLYPNCPWLLRKKGLKKRHHFLVNKHLKTWRTCEDNCGNCIYAQWVLNRALTSSVTFFLMNSTTSRYFWDMLPQGIPTTESSS